MQVFLITRKHATMSQDSATMSQDSVSASSKSTAAPPGMAGMSLVNLSARQRMLSQRLTLQIVLAHQGHPGQWEAARKSLQLFTESQAHLVQTARSLPEPEGRELRATYFEPMHVARTVDTFIGHAQEALQAARATSPNGQRALQRLVDSVDGVLDALNAATTAFDHLSAAKEDALMRSLRGIVGEIEAVAREAKIVSFNAQVIAARAGAVGKEFAVVANTLATISSQIDTLAKKGLALSAK